MSDPGPPGGRSGPSLARPYAWTEGRTRPTVELAIEALVQTTPEGRTVPFNRASPLSMVTQLCLQPRSMAEIAAHLTVPLQVARVLVADLLGSGWVIVRDTLSENASWDERHDLLERVLSGLRTL
ncbi:DUF742 domain-containing protein [Amycolatopsis acidiphila]|uniref:DUF742 domain-containing protein n=1 Tax=Amycolatopsis acidiphila TaxID=715473 RepID=A0A558AAD3_9PSEU|nr:DUF742 domain-containing protein [Amycolatopsis acidiphila]TVT21213.1 DUF742 domain-containing protein [Amycolatopsis acidiphila]UIJ61228.1 DUF742 domain-containing protein [Amycolatopsis acidiphila]GHG78688.1 hypothetical protein GCM10017788_46210 [Amycolatopsis acidiphila]